MLNELKYFFSLKGKEKCENLTINNVKQPLLDEKSGQKWVFKLPNFKAFELR